VILRLDDWDRAADADDRALLEHCVGPILDVGCGPGRLTALLAELGQVVLGIDVLHAAVGQTRIRGGSALHRDVFDELPGEGRWRTALLADGNLGIGGDPLALLKRLRGLIDPRGRIVAELAPPGVGVWSGLARICYGDREDCRPIRWSVIGIDAIVELAEAAGLVVAGCHRFGERWCAVLEEAA
jgi:SAM-dependent methyltransferase